MASVLCFFFFLLLFFFIHGRPNSGSAGRARTRDSFYRKSIQNHTEEANNNESQIKEGNKEEKKNIKPPWIGAQRDRHTDSGMIGC